MKRILFLGNYPPRKCGIATFTADLRNSLAAIAPETDFPVIAMNNAGASYDYPSVVRMSIDDADPDTYSHAARFVNQTGTDLVCVQHEYGIFGGKAGDYLLRFLDELTVPIVTTLHTVLQEPDAAQHFVLTELIRRSSRVVVMSETAREYLGSLYQAPPGKVVTIPHGIPDVPLFNPDHAPYKAKFGVAGRRTLMTFGLLSPNKGLEHVIQALPAIVARYPDTMYLIVGQTHPAVESQFGQQYQNSLRELAGTLGVLQNVAFHDRYVSLEELIEFIGATDIYVTPYLNPQQAVSGTLAYTVGAGKAVISTPYIYAKEVLADGRGRLVPFADPAAIAEAALAVFDNPAESDMLRNKAYQLGRRMIWPVVAQQYVQVFDSAIATADVKRPALTPIRAQRSAPAIKLDHIVRLTDDTGMIQHAVHTLPNYHEGYCTDDNARALGLMAQFDAAEQGPDARVEQLAGRYLAFLWYAFNPATGRFRNFMSYGRQWLDEQGSEDSHGRALAALAKVLIGTHWQSYQEIALSLFKAALPATEHFVSPRGMAQTMCALAGDQPQLAAFPSIDGLLEEFAHRLATLYRANQRTDWLWFEDRLTYDNAILPRAMLLAGSRLYQPEYTRIGLESLAWLTAVQHSPTGHFSPTGSEGFWIYGQQRAVYDQQPIEAAATVSACLTAFTLTGDQTWMAEAETAFAWYLGANDLRLPLYDIRSGGCRDGLRPANLNQNQGAESTLAFWQALAELRIAGLLGHGKSERNVRGSQVLPSPDGLLLGPHATMVTT